MRADRRVCLPGDKQQHVVRNHHDRRCYSVGPLDRPITRQRSALPEPSSRCRLARNSSYRPQLSTCGNTCRAVGDAIASLFFVRASAPAAAAAAEQMVSAHLVDPVELLQVGQSAQRHFLLAGASTVRRRGHSCCCSGGQGRQRRRSGRLHHPARIHVFTHPQVARRSRREELGERRQQGGGRFTLASEPVLTEGRPAAWAWVRREQLTARAGLAEPLAAGDAGVLRLMTHERCLQWLSEPLNVPKLGFLRHNRRRCR